LNASSITRCSSSLPLRSNLQKAGASPYLPPAAKDAALHEAHETRTANLIPTVVNKAGKFVAVRRAIARRVTKFLGRRILAKKNGGYRRTGKNDLRMVREAQRMSSASVEARGTIASPRASNPFSILSSDDPVALGLRDSTRRMLGIAVFSGVINILMLSGSLYMLQVYDRVIPSRNTATLWVCRSWSCSPTSCRDTSTRCDHECFAG
jgi:hypothetical protein